MARYVGSTELQLHNEATAMCGGRYESLRRPELHDFLVRHLQLTKAERQAKCEAARLSREARWTAIRDGRTSPVSILHLERFYTEDAKAAA